MHSVNINEILSAFSLALDVAENKTFEHSQRTAYIALRIARAMGLSDEVLKDIYAAALLHDIGMVNALADVHMDQNLVVEHCNAGKDIVDSLPISSIVSEYILWHHANWDGSGPFARKGNEIPLGAQIVYLADQLDLRLKTLTDNHTERFKITEFAKSAAGTFFCPEIVEAFLSVQEKEKFWLDYNHYNLSEVLLNIEPKNEVNLNIDGLAGVALTFAKIIDNKSPFTHNHSQGVTVLLAKFGEHYRFDDQILKLLKISGLLHDLGKLAVPTSILEKPGKLTQLEYLIIKSHPYYTKRILARVKEFEVIKEWAGNHHESLDGQGYPEGLSIEGMSHQERMIAICDIYQALTEERPYRPALAESKVFAIIEDMVKDGKLCPQTFSDFKKLLVG